MRRAKAFLGLELKDDVLKIVELSKSDRGVYLERFVYERLPDGWVSGGVLLQPGLLNEFLQDVIDREAFQTRKVHLSIDSPHFVLVEKTYPAMKKKDLRKVIALEIEEQMELPFNDPWYEVIALKKPQKKVEHSEWRVLLILTSEAFVRTYANVIRSCGLKPVSIDLAPLAIHRWLKYVRPKDEIEANIVIANLSTHGVSVSAFTEHVLAKSHAIALPMSSFQTEQKANDFPYHLHKDQDIRDYTALLAAKLKSFVHDGSGNSEFILTGEGVSLYKVRDLLRNLNQEMDMRVTVLTGEIPISEALLYRQLNHLKPSLCLPMGLALKGLVRA